MSSSSGNDGRGPGRPPSRRGVTKSHGFSHKRERQGGRERLAISRGQFT